MEAVQVDAVQIDSARLDSTHSSTPPTWTPTTTTKRSSKSATTDAPDGTHREERRITRTTHHPHGKGRPESWHRRQAPRVTLIVPPRLLTRANLKRTPRPSARSPAPSRTRRVAPAHRLFRTLSKVPRREEPGGVEERSSTPMFVASVLYLLAFAAPIMSTRIQGAVATRTSTSFR